jgi:hypothetical protein
MFLEEESVHVCLKCGQHLPHYADCDAIVAPLTWSSLGSAGTHFMLGNTSDCDIYHHHQLLRRKEGAAAAAAAAAAAGAAAAEEEEEEEEEEAAKLPTAAAAAEAAATAREQRQAGIIAQSKELLERVGENFFFSGCLVQAASENLTAYRHLMRTVEQGRALAALSLYESCRIHAVERDASDLCALFEIRLSDFWRMEKRASSLSAQRRPRPRQQQQQQQRLQRRRRRQQTSAAPAEQRFSLIWTMHKSILLPHFSHREFVAIGLMVARLQIMTSCRSKTLLAAILVLAGKVALVGTIVPASSQAAPLSPSPSTPPPTPPPPPPTLTAGVCANLADVSKTSVFRLVKRLRDGESSFRVTAELGELFSASRATARPLDQPAAAVSGAACGRRGRIVSIK